MKNKAQTDARPDGRCPQKSADVRDGSGLPGHGAKPEAVREQAALALLSEKTIAAAARRSGVNEKTLRRWMADDEAFKKELAEMRSQGRPRGGSILC